MCRVWIGEIGVRNPNLGFPPNTEMGVWLQTVTTLQHRNERGMWVATAHMLAWAAICGLAVNMMHAVQRYAPGMHATPKSSNSARPPDNEVRDIQVTIRLNTNDESVNIVCILTYQIINRNSVQLFQRLLVKITAIYHYSTIHKSYSEHLVRMT